MVKIHTQVRIHHMICLRKEQNELLRWDIKMNKNKFNRKTNSSQESSLEENKSKPITQVKPNEELDLLDKMMSNKQAELDNPNFVLGYN